MITFLELFWSFFQIGLFSIGGGYAALPLIQAQVDDHDGVLRHYHHFPDDPRPHCH